jgi:hypothetical protein
MGDDVLDAHLAWHAEEPAVTGTDDYTQHPLAPDAFRTEGAAFVILKRRVMR